MEGLKSGPLQAGAPLLEGILQSPPVERLGEAGVEAGPERALAILGLAVAGERHQPHPLTELLAHLLGHLKAVEAGEAEVDERQLGASAEDQLQPGLSVGRDLD